jgi:hypothetical protein
MADGAVGQMDAVADHGVDAAQGGIAAPVGPLPGYRRPGLRGRADGNLLRREADVDAAADHVGPLYRRNRHDHFARVPAGQVDDEPAHAPGGIVEEQVGHDAALAVAAHHRASDHRRSVPQHVALRPLASGLAAPAGSTLPRPPGCHMAGPH